MPPCQAVQQSSYPVLGDRLADAFATLREQSESGIKGGLIPLSVSTEALYAMLAY